MVVIRRVFRSRRRIRWLSRSQKYIAPSGPIVIPYGLFTWVSVKPGAPVPTRVVTDGPVAAAGVRRRADSSSASFFTAMIVCGAKGGKKIKGGSASQYTVE